MAGAGELAGAGRRNRAELRLPLATKARMRTRPSLAAAPAASCLETPEPVGTTEVLSRGRGRRHSRGRFMARWLDSFVGEATDGEAVRQTCSAGQVGAQNSSDLTSAIARVLVKNSGWGQSEAVLRPLLRR
jgi:hypothetical protein